MAARGLRRRAREIRANLAASALALLVAACAAAVPVGDAAEAGSPWLRRSPLFIIGQDLGAVRDYHASGCCVEPDGNTAYLDLYDVLDPLAGFGGLGMDPDGNILDIEPDFTAGPSNLWKSATGFGGGFAIGLSLTENHHPGAIGRLDAGEYDDHVRQLARFLNRIQGPVWLRIGYEFEGFWNRGYGDPERYVRVYRRIVDLLRAEGVGNTEYVWQTSASPIDDILDGGAREDIRRWYPGDAYVDWMATSWFRHPDETPPVDPGFQVPTQRELTAELLAFARQRGKPVMLAEAAPQAYDLARNFYARHAPIWDGDPRTGPVGLSDEEIWARWYAPLFEFLDRNRDVVGALAYINADWDAQEMWGAPYANGFWGDSRLQANPQIAARFNRAVTDWRGR